MEPRAHLLPRLFIDVVLPSTIAALALILALCVQQTHNLAERVDSAASLRLARLAGELDVPGGVSPQMALDRTLQEGKGDQVVRVEWHGSDGSLWSSGTPSALGGSTYRSEVRPHGPASSWVSMQVDTRPLRKA